jgi:2-polyprenyl-3-methyl-5-hydroxy-6-metoxy-1,4-benzoquinol methylase
MKCILCNSDYELYTKTSYLELPTFHCRKCNLIVTGDNESEIITKTNQIYKQKHWGKGNLWDAENAIRSDYTDSDSQGKKRTWISQYKYCKPYLKDKKTILEIGAGQGQASWWFEQKGFQITGVEPDEKNVELINKKLKFGKCISSSAETFEIDKKFDVIWMSHVLEHLIKPDFFLSKVKKNLTNDGIFFIEVPNCENNLTLKTSINLVPHTFHFSKNALIRLAEKNFYQVLKCDYFRPATKFEGLSQKIMKMHPYYPRILSKKHEGIFLRIILKMIKK